MTRPAGRTLTFDNGAIVTMKDDEYALYRKIVPYYPAATFDLDFGVMSRKRARYLLRDKWSAKGIFKCGPVHWSKGWLLSKEVEESASG